MILFINTYKASPFHLDFNLRCSIKGLHYSLRTNIDLNPITADQPGFSPKSRIPKAATFLFCYATIVLHSIDTVKYRKIST